VDVDQQYQILLGHKYKKAKSVAKKVGNKRKILLLGSSHGREIGPMLKESLGKGFDIVSILKPNAPLAKCRRRKPGNSLDRMTVIV
jgi:hypothetical protein